MEAIIRLFKAVPIDVKKVVKTVPLDETFKYGFIFTPEVIYNYPNRDNLIKMVKKFISIEHINNAFHKSWEKIKEASIEQLVTEQIIHYITTYGFELLGIYDDNSVYIPNEKLEVPEFEGINLTVIKGLTKKEIKEKLLELINSGIALAENTITDVVDIAIFVGLNEKEINNIQNKEVKIALYEHMNLVPENPVEFLRFIIYKATEKTLIIKSPELIEEIRGKKLLNIVKLFENYEKKNGLNKLAEIFYRFKPLFLAFRSNSHLKKIINRIRRLAKTYHKPLPEDFLNSITKKLKNNCYINEDKLQKELNKVNVFRKIRLAYALNFRTKTSKSILYKIRNGKGYGTDFNFSEPKDAQEILDIVIQSIVKDVSKKIKGKTIYIPEYMNYTLPATEKQFTGNFPSGSFISISSDMIVGIHWENTNHCGIDLDLSLISPNTGKIGWDSSYRTADRTILFSGDITNAPEPKGASELFYIQKQKADAFIMFVNYYNYEPKNEVPFKIIVAKEKVENFKENYMINPNNILSMANSTIDKKQKILGILVSDEKGSQFYFTETYLGRSITSSGSNFVKHARKYLFNFYKDTIKLKDILIQAGAKMVTDSTKADIDLTPEKIDKNSILNLIK